MNNKSKGSIMQHRYNLTSTWKKCPEHRKCRLNCILKLIFEKIIFNNLVKQYKGPGTLKLNNIYFKAFEPWFHKVF